MIRGRKSRICLAAAKLNYLAASVKKRRRINKGTGVVLAGAGIAIMVK